MKGFKPKILFINTHSIEPYKLTLTSYANLDSHPHKYCKVVMNFADPLLAYMSLDVKEKTITFHKFGHPMIAYPVSLNKGRFGYEISKILVEDVIRSDADILHIHNYYSLTYDLIALLNVKRIPIVGHYHGGDIKMLPYIFRLFKKMSIPMADKLLVTNKFELKRLISNFNLPTEKIAYIHEGIDVNLFKPIGKAYKEDNIVLFVGNLVKEKGIHNLLISFYFCKKKINNLKLWIVGEGYLRDYLQSKAKALGLQNDVRFFGRLSHRELSLIYNKATVTVLPSKSESLGLVMLESMACGTPVVATVNEGSLEIITHMQDGILVPQNDIKALANAICKILSDKDLQLHLAKNARKKVVNEFSLDVFASKLYELYKELLEKN
jgi:glycosyltransferase involved in cell wall biosynthesis